MKEGREKAMKVRQKERKFELMLVTETRQKQISSLTHPGGLVKVAVDASSAPCGQSVQSSTLTIELVLLQRKHLGGLNIRVLLGSTHTQTNLHTPCSTESWGPQRGGTAVVASCGPGRRGRSQSAAGQGLNLQDLEATTMTWMRI